MMRTKIKHLSIPVSLTRLTGHTGHSHSLVWYLGKKSLLCCGGKAFMKIFCKQNVHLLAASR